MAESIFNHIMDGMSGRVGKYMTFRQKSGKTIVATQKKRKKKGSTAKQLEVRERFQEATDYALAALENPALRAEFESAANGSLTSYNLAMADFYKKPQFMGRKIHALEYAGAPGDLLSVRLSDPQRIVSIRVTLLDSAGAVIEAGPMAKASSGSSWTYVVTMAHDPLGGKAVFVAVDRVGNSTEHTVSL